MGPQGGEFKVQQCRHVLSLISVQESGDTGLQGALQAKEENGTNVFPKLLPSHFLICPMLPVSGARALNFLPVTQNRPPRAPRPPRATRTPSSSAGSSRSRPCRSAWGTLQVNKEPPRRPAGLTMVTLGVKRTPSGALTRTLTRQFLALGSRSFHKSLCFDKR